MSDKYAALRKAADRALIELDPNMFVETSDILALLAERGADKRRIEELEAANALNKHLELATRKAEGCSEALRRRAEAAENRVGELEVIATDYGMKFQRAHDDLKKWR